MAARMRIVEQPICMWGHIAPRELRSILTLTLMDVPRLLFVQRLFSLSGTDPSRAITRYTAGSGCGKDNKNK